MKFTHLDEEGKPSMVDVSGKHITQRLAIAQSRVVLGENILKQLEGGDLQTKKGPVFQTAIIAGVMAAKKTSDLIPLCHPLSINKCDVSITVENKETVLVTCLVKTEGKTGVEMEALTGASVAALTIYDMCKAFSHHISIVETRLLEKTGGKNDFKSE